jgi:serine/threonine protein kinase
LTIDGGVKLCDFGVSKQIKPGDRMSDQCGTPAYIAPEILEDKGYEGFAVDLWSAGVVLYAILYGTVPFRANNMTELQKMIKSANYTLAEGISKQAKNLLKRLLEKDPLQRITIAQIKSHPWLQDAKDSVQLFTNAEKNYMLTQLNNQPISGGTDYLSDHLLQSDHKTLANCETKSVILAPFNSTRSNLKEIEEHYSLPQEIRDLIQSKSCLRFEGRVREIDK